MDEERNSKEVRAEERAEEERHEEYDDEYDDEEYHDEEDDRDHYFTCPECGYPLSRHMSIDDRGEFVMEFYCEGPGEDTFCFQIATGLSNKDIPQLKKRKAIKKEMVVKLQYRQSEKQYLAESEKRRSQHFRSQNP